ASSDDSRSLDRRFKQHAASAEPADHRVWQRRTGARDAHQFALRRFDSLADRLRHFLGFTGAVTDYAVLIADHDKRAERQIFTAYDHLGAAFVKYYMIFQLKPVEIHSN